MSKTGSLQLVITMLFNYFGGRRMLDIRTVTVIGANGTMGLNACAMFASFGNAKVYMISRDSQKSRNAIEKAIKAVRAESIRNNLIPCDYSSLEKCVSESDLVFESVAEDLAIKKEITKQIGKYAGEDTIIATGTSGLSINTISETLPNSCRQNYYGMHFFNPPYSMPLLELIPNNSATENKISDIIEYLDKNLLRNVVVCKDKPAFVANRIGFQFLNMALRYAEKYKEKGGIDYIDSILGTFTGRSMTPCATVDFVGLDVHKAIVDNLLNNTNDYENKTFTLPIYVQKLISQGRLGLKTGIGLFKTEIDESGVKHKYVFDIKTNKYVPIRKYDVAFAKKMNLFLKNGDYDLAFDTLNNDYSEEATICREFLKTYIDYSIYVGKEVCTNVKYVDDAMASGFNWCPPLALSNALFGTSYSTKYDYRSFFKAVK